MSKVLVVYYSRTGNTRRLAEAIAGAGQFDIEPVIDSRPRLGLIGYVRSSFEAMRAKLTPIAPPQRDPHRYELVVIGTPVWFASVSSPIRTFLAQQHAGMPKVAFFATCGGRGAERAFEQMAAVGGRDPVATLFLTERDLAHAALEPRAHEFAAALADVVGREPIQPSPPSAPAPA